ncbi:MAG: 50S ribosomal protein L25 [SAR202 cluster bacterium]|nr:50S ribosomal protein L25 [SAR202 cluster bacterium]
MNQLAIDITHRTTVGKKVKKLRQNGKIPIRLFGGGIDPMPMQADASSLGKILSQAGFNSPIFVNFDSSKEENVCFIREIQRDPITEELLHIDLLKVDMSKKVTVEVPVRLFGVPDAVKNLGGILLQSINSIPVSALPLSIPESISVDVSILVDFDKSIRIKDIEFGDGVDPERDPDTLIARVVPPRIDEEVESEEGEIDPDAELTEDSGEATEESTENSSEASEA